jgi:hypothetical protein
MVEKCMGNLQVVDKAQSPVLCGKKGPCLVAWLGFHYSPHPKVLSCVKTSVGWVFDFF